MKEKLLKFYYSRTFQIWMDIVRIMLLVFMGVIIYILITEIEAIKILAYDPCQICINKTGATCFHFSYQ